MSASRISAAWRRLLALGVAATLAAAAAVTSLGTTTAHAADQTYTHPDGATVSYDHEAVVGEKITVSGTGWLAKPDMVEVGEEGSVIGFKLIGGDGQLNRSFALDNPRLGEPIANTTVWGAVWADSEGNFEVELDWPDAGNATADPQWEAGDSFTLQLLSGTLYSNQPGADPSERPDVSRTVGLTITVVAADEPEPAGEISLTNSTVEQRNDLWFNLGGFEPAAAVTVELVNGAGAAIASKPFTIGEDGNTANPDGQTYRKLVVPRDAAPGADYAVRVVSGDQVLATSEPVTVTAATTRVYNPGDHAGGVEDLLVQRGGVWTFHAVGFAPGGKLAATAVVEGETVTLSGLGQLSATERAWQLDANGDTLREPVFTRVQIPSSVEPGDLEVTFTDGAKNVSRTLTVEASTEASVTVDPSAKLGGTIRVTGAGFLHPNGTEGSKIAIKLNDGAFSRMDTSLHVNRTIWWIVEADEFGSFSIDMPVPNGTTADDGDTLGSDPALTPGGGYTLRFLTGSLKPADQSRTLKSDPFTVTEGEPEPVAPVATVKPSITGLPAAGSALTATPGAWDVSGLGFAYQWLRDGTAISGATTSTYKVASGDAGKSLSVRVTASKTGLPDGTATSAAVKAGKALTKTPTPAISGTGKVGKTLKAKAGTWKPSKVKLSYQWLRDGEPIAKATKSSYKLAKADAGRKITVRVTGSKSGYVSVAKTSKAKSVAKVKAKVKLSLPSKVAKVAQATAKLTVTAAVANPAGTVKVTVNGKTVTAALTTAGKGKISVKLPAIGKKGKYKVKASFTPTGETGASTSKSSTVSKTLKVR